MSVTFNQPTEQHSAFHADVLYEDSKHKVSMSGSHVHGINFECSTCKMQFVNKKIAKKHKKAHNVNGFECNFCNKIFQYRSHLLVHKRKHTVEKPYKCDVCYKVFVKFSYVTEHKKLHTGGKPYICGRCNRTFSVWQYYKKHIQYHTRKKVYGCTSCDKNFHKPWKLRRHEKIHTKTNLKQNKFKANSGFTESTMRNKELERNGNLQADSKCKTSEVCNVFPVTPSSNTVKVKIEEKSECDDDSGNSCAHFKEAEDTEHIIVKPELNYMDLKAEDDGDTLDFECVTVKPEIKDTHFNVEDVVCGTQNYIDEPCQGDNVAVEDYSLFFTSSKDNQNNNYIFQTASLHALGGREAQFECDVCTKKFSRIKLLQFHKKLHVKDYVCTFCNKMFALPSALRNHAKKHAGERLHKCDVCPEMFVKHSALSFHMKQHLSQEDCASERKTPFKCIVCSKSFENMWGLGKHADVHTDEELETYRDTCNELQVNTGIGGHTLQNRREKNVTGKGSTNIKNKSTEARKFRMSRSSPVGECHVGAAWGKTNKIKVPFKCIVCNKSFSDLWKLGIHADVHTDDGLETNIHIFNELPINSCSDAHTLQNQREIHQSDASLPRFEQEKMAERGSSNVKSSLTEVQDVYSSRSSAHTILKEIKKECETTDCDNPSEHDCETKEQNFVDFEHVVVKPELKDFDFKVEDLESNIIQKTDNESAQ